MFEANRGFLQDLGTLLKPKVFLAREVRLEFRQDPLQSHHPGKGEADAFACLYLGRKAGNGKYPPLVVREWPERSEQCRLHTVVGRPLVLMMR